MVACVFAPSPQLPYLLTGGDEHVGVARERSRQLSRHVLSPQQGRLDLGGWLLRHSSCGKIVVAGLTYIGWVPG